MLLRFNTTIEQMANNGYIPILKPSMIRIGVKQPESEFEMRKFLRDQREPILKNAVEMYARAHGDSMASTIDAFVIHTHTSPSQIIQSGDKYFLYYAVLPYKKS